MTTTFEDIAMRIIGGVVFFLVLAPATSWSLAFCWYAYKWALTL